MFCAVCSTKHHPHKCQQEIAEDSDISYVIQFTQLERVGFFVNFVLNTGPLLPADPIQILNSEELKDSPRFALIQ